MVFMQEVSVACAPQNSIGKLGVVALSLRRERNSNYEEQALLVKRFVASALKTSLE